MTLQMQHILRRLFQADSLDEVPRERLEELVNQHPSFGAARYLLSKKLQTDKAGDFLQQTGKTHLYFTNPYWLQWLLDGVDENSAKAVKADEIAATPAANAFTAYRDTLVTEGVVLTDEEVEVVQEEAKTGYAHELISEPVQAETVEVGEEHAVEHAVEPVEKHATEIVEKYTMVPAEEYPTEVADEKTKGIIGEYTARTADDDDMKAVEEFSPAFGTEPDVKAEHVQEPVREDAARETAKEEVVQEPETRETIPELVAVEEKEPERETVPEPVNDPIQEIIAEPIQETHGEIVTEPIVETAPEAVHQPTLVIDPYHTIDYFASQGIRFVQEENPSDKLGKQLKSFTEWLKVMKRLPKKQEEAVPDPATEHRILAFAAHSNETREIVTETMAEVLAMQGMAGKAVDVYRKLSLLNPDKSAYFAAKIEQLKVN